MCLSIRAKYTEKELGLSFRAKYLENEYKVFVYWGKVHRNGAKFV